MNYVSIISRARNRDAGDFLENKMDNGPYHY